MACNLRKFVNPQFLRSVDRALLARLLARHRHALAGLDIDSLPLQPEAAGDSLLAFFAGPEEGYPAGLVADLHRIAALGNAKGLRLILAEAARIRLKFVPESGTEEPERRQDSKYVALRIFLDHPAGLCHVDGGACKAWLDRPSRGSDLAPSGE